MTERLCPMCKKHPIVISQRKARTIINGKKVEYNEEICFCSTLGMNDPDSCFIPPDIMDKNLEAARRAYMEG